jgi:hypothetical protein
MQQAARQTRRMMSPDQPCRHPVSSGRDVCHTRIDVVPRQLRLSPTEQGILNSFVELAEIVKSRRSIDRVEESWRWIHHRTVQEGLSTFASTAPNIQDVFGIALGFAILARRRVS